jgi:hypothetical protein
MKVFWKIIIGFIPILILGLIVVQFMISNELAAYGNKMGDMEKRIGSLSTQNQILEKQVALVRSLTTIEKKAYDLGFMKSTSYLTIQSSQPVALK